MGQRSVSRLSGCRRQLHSRGRLRHTRNSIGAKDGPVVAEFFPAAAAGTMGAQLDAGARDDFLDGNQVPDAPGNHQSRQQIYFTSSVGTLVGAAAAGDAKDPGVGSRGRTHLHTPKARAGINDEIVTSVVTPWAGDSEAALGGLLQKAHLYPLTETLGRVVEWHGVSGKRVIWLSGFGMTRRSKQSRTFFFPTETKSH